MEARAPQNRNSSKPQNVVEKQKIQVDEDKQMRHISRQLVEMYICVSEGFRTCKDKSTQIPNAVLVEIQAFLSQVKSHVLQSILENVSDTDKKSDLEANFNKKFSKKSELFKRLEDSIFFTFQSLINVKPVSVPTNPVKSINQLDSETKNTQIASDPGKLAESTYIQNNSSISQILPTKDIFWSNQALNYLEKIDDLYLESKSECCCVTTSPQNDYFIGQFNGCVEKRNLQDPSRNQTFRVVPANENCNIRCIRRDPRGRLWISTTDTLIVASQSGKVIFKKRGTSSTNLLYGYLYKMVVDPNWNFVIWWSGIDSFMIVDARNLKILHLKQGLLVNPGELPCDFSVLGTDFKDMLILTNYKRNRQYHWVQLRCRKVQFNMRIPGPVDADGLRVGFMSLAQNCPSSLIVATGSANTLDDPVPKGLITAYRFNPLSFKPDAREIDPTHGLNQQTNLTFLAQDTQDLGPLITKPTFLSSRLVICIIIKHVCLYDVGLGENKMDLIVRIRNVNRGESVTDICLRNKQQEKDVLFVGNCGQIFRVKFKI